MRTVAAAVALLLSAQYAGASLEFSAPVNSLAGTGYSLVVEELTGDTLDDVVAMTDSTHIGTSLGGGIFSVASTYAGTGRGAILARVDSDTTPDLVWVASRWVELRLGRGGGAFNPVQIIEAASVFDSDLSSVAAGDVDSDGNIDLVTDHSVLLGHGNGTFDPWQPLPGGGQYVALGDFDFDSKLDAAVANGHSVTVLHGEGDGSFTPAGAYPTVLSVSLLAADLDGNGTTDLAIADEFPDSVIILLGDGAGGFPQRRSFRTGVEPIQVTCGDLDDDGVLDLVTANYGSSDVSVLRGLGLGDFQTAQLPCGDFPQDVSVGDVTGDGLPDIMVATQGHVVTLINESTTSAHDGRPSDTSRREGSAFRLLVDLSGRVHFAIKDPPEDVVNLSVFDISGRRLAPRVIVPLSFVLDRGISLRDQFPSVPVGVCLLRASCGVLQASGRVVLLR